MLSDQEHRAVAASREDEAILAAVRALQAGGRSDAFEPIFRRFLPQLLRFFSGRGYSTAEADDLAQTTLDRVFRNIDKYRFEAPFASWLLRIAENVWKNDFRDRQAAKRGAPAESLDSAGKGKEEPGPLQVADAGPNPEEAALVAERVRVVRSAVEELPPGMRRCTELRLYSELQDREISAVTGIGLAAVRSQLYEARKRLKPLLEQYFQGVDF